MRILVVRLHGLTADRLFADERLTNVRRLMDGGCFGVVDAPPGGAGAAPTAPLWEEVARQGKRIALLRVPLPAALRHPALLCWECPVGSGAATEIYAHPRELAAQLSASFPTRKAEDGTPLDPLARMRTGFGVTAQLLQQGHHDYLELADTGLENVDPTRPAERDGIAVSEASGGADRYCLELDEEMGKLLELVEEDTIILVASAGSLVPGRVSPPWFILAAAHSPLEGELSGVTPSDLSATVLQLAGLAEPSLTGGKSLLEQDAFKSAPAAGGQEPIDEEDLIRRLRGLGYID